MRLPMPSRKKPTNGSSNGANLGFEATLWAAADKMRNNMDAAEYKHVVLGLIFLKYISDAFDEKHAALAAEAEGADPEDQDEYRRPSTCGDARFLGEPLLRPVLLVAQVPYPYRKVPDDLVFALQAPSSWAAYYE
jgi:hypothetical protein